MLLVPVSLGSWPGGAWVPWRAVPLVGVDSVFHRRVVSCGSLTVSPAKRVSPKFMMMASWFYFSLSLTDRVAWTARQLRGKNLKLLRRFIFRQKKEGRQVSKGFKKVSEPFQWDIGYAGKN